jgi:hypothetical protein
LTPPDLIRSSTTFSKLEKERGRFFIGGGEVQISNFLLPLFLQIVPSHIGRVREGRKFGAK